MQRSAFYKHEDIVTLHCYHKCMSERLTWLAIESQSELEVAFCESSNLLGCSAGLCCLCWLIVQRVAWTLCTHGTVAECFSRTMRKRQAFVMKNSIWWILHVRLPQLWQGPLLSCLACWIRTWQEPTRRVVQEGDGVLTFAIDHLGLNACTSHRCHHMNHQWVNEFVCVCDDFLLPLLAFESDLMWSLWKVKHSVRSGLLRHFTLGQQSSEMRTWSLISRLAL